MNSNYIIRQAESPEDGERLRQLFTEIFHPEPVGIFAETVFHHFPRMENKYWFITEEKKTHTIAAAFALVPWQLEIEGISLKAGEMGIVGTREKDRNQGLMKSMNQEFEKRLVEESFDISIIQGIPGFYHRLGYFYAIPLENHINIPLHVIPDESDGDYTFYRAGIKDIPFLMQEDEFYRKSNWISTFRDEANWKYLLTESMKTEYGSEFWIIENRDKPEKFYLRIPGKGFGKGLIISEISESISYEAMSRLFIFCKQQAIARQKPYIRFNLHNESAAGKIAISIGAEKGRPYAWQIKIPDKIRFLKKIAPILEKRIKNSCFRGFSETIRLDLFKTKTDMIWNNGKLESVEPGKTDACENTLCINEDLFPALCLGHRTWQELQHIRPDIFPEPQYIRPELCTVSDKIGLLTDVLFPATKSWIYEQY